MTDDELKEWLRPLSPSDALDYLRKVYNNELESTHTRMRAAAIAIEYERPRLAVTASITANNFQEIIERRMKRAEEHGLLELKALPAPGFRKRV
jgi:hypothetical protein